MNKKIIEQVPQDYYFNGVKSNPFQKYWHGKKWIELRSLLKNEKGRLLDIGCADGTTTSAIANSNKKFKVTGIDYYRKAIEFAGKTYKNIQFTEGDAHKLPFDNQSFDLVTAIETLEHLQNPRQVLAEIRRVLKPNGKLLVVQDTDSIIFKTIWWFWTKSKGSVWKNSHISCMKKNDLLTELKEAGFKIMIVKDSFLGMEVFIKSKKF